jgi:hypothetical protein
LGTRGFIELLGVFNDVVKNIRNDTDNSMTRDDFNVSDHRVSS